MTRLFTSDLHFGHANIIRYCNRPFADVGEMNEGLVANWNEVVGADDEVWVLGDVAMGPIHESLSFVGRLAGRKVLVAGNHDRCWAGHGPASEKWIDVYRDAGFDAILQGAVTTTVAGIEVRCCHFPYAGDSRDEERFVAERPADDGLVLLHGHVHEKWRTNGRQINVGVDRWNYRPVPEATLVGLISAAASGPADAGSEVDPAVGEVGAGAAASVEGDQPPR